MTFTAEPDFCLATSYSNSDLPLFSLGLALLAQEFPNCVTRISCPVRWVFLFSRVLVTEASMDKQVLWSGLLISLCLTRLGLGEEEAAANQQNAIPDDLKIETISKPDPCDRVAADGDMLVMHYTGLLEKDGTKFDSSYDKPSPFTFQLGRRQVIPGWDMGLLGMCKGEKRKLTIPPNLAYGDRGAGNLIPGGATLVFETELLDIHDAPPQQNIFKAIDADEDRKLSKVELYKFIESQVEQHQQGGSEAIDKDKIINEIFANEDTDKDGFISHDEFRGPKHDEL